MSKSLTTAATAGVGFVVGIAIGTHWNSIKSTLFGSGEDDVQLDHHSESPRHGSATSHSGGIIVAESHLSRAELLLQWWFNGPFGAETGESYSEAARARWFTAGPVQAEADAEISHEWGALVAEASSWARHLTGSCTRSKDGGGLKNTSAKNALPERRVTAPPDWVQAWRATPRGSLALVVLLDQFSRHVKRHNKVRSSAKESAASTGGGSPKVLVSKRGEGGGVSGEEEERSVDVDACSAAARFEVLTAWEGVDAAVAAAWQGLPHIAFVGSPPEGNNPCLEAVAVAAASSASGSGGGVGGGGGDSTQKIPQSQKRLVASKLPLHSPTSEKLFRLEHLNTAELVFLLMPFRHGVASAPLVPSTALTATPLCAGPPSPVAAAAEYASSSSSSSSSASRAVITEGEEAVAVVESLHDRRAQLGMVLAALERKDAELRAEAELVGRFRKQTARALNAADDAAKAPRGVSKAGDSGGTAASEATPATVARSMAGGGGSNGVGGSGGGGDEKEEKEEEEEFDDLLERLPLACDESKLEVGADKLLHTLDAFLSAHFDPLLLLPLLPTREACASPLSSFPSANANADNGEEHERQQQQHKRSPILALSLSGGVDSMVLLKLLSCPWLRRRHGDYAVLSLHVDYGNRPEASREAQFVRAHCEELFSSSSSSSACLFEVLEVGGGRCEGSGMSRDEFERTSRVRRFDFYKHSIEKHSSNKAPPPPPSPSNSFGGSSSGGSSSNSSNSSSSSSSLGVNVDVGAGVLLAHHLGDVEENVLSNALHGLSPDCLSGMREVGAVEATNVWRPLLPWRKDEILRFAHQYGVPYFLDSTPSWSTRFALRQRLLPAIASTYGEGAHHNLASLATNSDALHDLVQDVVVAPFVEKHVSFGKLGVEISGACEEAAGTCAGTGDDGGRGGGGHSLFWWRLVLLPLVHGLGNPMFSDKSLAVLLRRLRGDKPPLLAPKKATPLRTNRKDKSKNKNGAANSRSNNGRVREKAAAGSLPLPSASPPLSACLSPPPSAHAAAATARREKANTLKAQARRKEGKKEGEEGASPFPRDGWLELRKEWATYLQDGKLFLFRACVYPQGLQKQHQRNQQQPQHQQQQPQHQQQPQASGNDSESSRSAHAPVSTPAVADMTAVCEWHCPEGSPLPLPSLGEVLHASAWSGLGLAANSTSKHAPPPIPAAAAAGSPASTSTPSGSGNGSRGGEEGAGWSVAGPWVQWGPWRVRAVVRTAAAAGQTRSRVPAPTVGGDSVSGSSPDDTKVATAAATTAATTLSSAQAPAAGAGKVAMGTPGVITPGGLLRLRGDDCDDDDDDEPLDWFQATNTLQKQAAMLPLSEVPALEDPILSSRGGLCHSSSGATPHSAGADSGNTRDKSSAARSSMPTSSSSSSPATSNDFAVLLQGTFKYSLLVPLPKKKKKASRAGADDDAQHLEVEASWDHGLTLQPDAKLLPLRHLDRTLRRIIPLVAPTPLHNTAGCGSVGGHQGDGTHRKSSFEEASSAVGSQLPAKRLHCLVDVEYCFGSV